MLLVLMALGLISSSLMAGVGTVTSVRAKFDGSTYVTLKRASDGVETTNILVGTPEAIKAMIAIALTAQSTGAATIELYFGTYDTTSGSISGWSSVNIK